MTMQSRTDLGGSCLSPSNMIQNIESSQVVETACQPVLRSFDNSERKHHSIDKKKGKSAEIDSLVQNAAASLEVELAKEKTNGYKLDRAHVFAVNMFDEIEKFLNVPDEWAPPETKPYRSGVSKKMLEEDPLALCTVKPLNLDVVSNELLIESFDHPHSGDV